MKQEKYQQVKRIFQWAVEHPPAERSQLIHELSGGDEELRLAVESLLTASERAEEFMEQPAVAQVADAIVVKTESLIIGEKLGRYSINSSLGSGGMGEVFLAEDIELERLVAVKVLSAEFSKDNERIRRFVQEAKAASALNHPNILTVYEIGRHDDLHFIAAEFIIGETLRQRLKGELLSLREILDIALQAAAALNAAHRSRIVHRDIKPENIMLRDDGFVKVLDFGLAKLVEKSDLPPGAEAVTRAQMQTHPGMIMGTVAYMSPEQARGTQTDARSDIWSLGVVLYEMLAGKPPFTGATATDVTASIIKSEPAPLGENAPAELKRIVRKALRKNCDERYQTVKDFLLDLKNLKHELEFSEELERTHHLSLESRASNVSTTMQLSGQTTTPNDAVAVTGNQSQHYRTSAIKRIVLENRRVFLTGTAVLFGFLAAVASLTLYRYAESGRTEISVEKITALTNTGNIVVAAVSQDGKLLATVKSDGDKQGMWLRYLSDKIAELPLVPSENQTLKGLRFTPDGSQIYYLTTNKNSTISRLLALPVLGGQPKVILENIETPPAFSPDGNLFAFIRADREKGLSTIFVANRDGTEVREIAARTDPSYYGVRPLVFSPDGKTVICIGKGNDDNQKSFVLEVNLDDGKERIVSVQPWVAVHSMVWTKEKDGLIVATDSASRPNSNQLWFLPVPTGEARQITGDLSEYVNVSLAAQTGDLIAVNYQDRSSLGVTSLHAPNVFNRISSNQRDGYLGLAYGADNRIFYTSFVDGALAVKSVTTAGGNPTQILVPNHEPKQLTTTPDGSFVIFSSNQNGTRNLWRMNTDGKNLQRLTTGIRDEFPVVSPDGKSVIYNSMIGSQWSCWTVPVEGGASEKVSSSILFRPQISPDGKFIAAYFRSEATAKAQFATFAFGSDSPIQTVPIPAGVKFGSLFSWTPDGKSLAVIDTRNGTENLWTLPLDEESPRSLTNFAPDLLPLTIHNFGWSPDRSTITLARGSNVVDVVKIAYK